MRILPKPPHRILDANKQMGKIVLTLT